MEVKHCPRCDQRLLADESVCWQCGYRLQEDQGLETPEPEQKSEGRGSEGRGSERRGLATPLTIYGLLTAFVIIVALLVTILLGRQPRVQAAAVPLPEGWTVVANATQAFTVYLPESWALYDPSDDEQSESIEQLMSAAPEYRMATEPLTGYVEDEEVLFLAQGSNAPGSGSGAGAFLIVVRSATLNGLTPVEAIGLAQESEALVTDVGQVSDFERSHVALRVEYEGEQGVELRCRQQFTNGERFALLLALCSTPGRFGEDAASTILQSAQRLAP